MDPITYILLFGGWLCSAYLSLRLHRIRPTQWRRVLPKEPGPSTDDHYRAVRLGGHEYWFTEEQVAVANERAVQNQ
jgi:hypothetical protein